MRRPWQTWSLFMVCLGLVMAVMAWVSTTMLELDDERLRVRRQAAFEEDIRLALWRIDSTLSPLIGRENARPTRDYRPFSSAAASPVQGRVRGWGQISSGDLLAPSPLLSQAPDYILLHFELDDSDRLTSPQAPIGEMRRLAQEHQLVTGAELDRFAQQLGKLDQSVAWDELSLVPMVSTRRPLIPVAPKKRGQAELDRLSLESQQMLNVAEFEARSNTFMQSASFDDFQQPASNLDIGLAELRSILQPVWLSSELLLVRQVVDEEGERLQGCWLDWQRLQSDLLASVADLLPTAGFEPAGDDEEPAELTAGRRLASLPVRLTPGSLPAATGHGATPIQLSLAVAWSCLALAAAAVFALLRGAVSLSERRGAFVSAVTHELRTPLTTLRIYAEMLADGLVREDGQQQEYLETMRAQSERLAHLVENVLAYSRLERGRRGGTLETVPVAELLAGLTEPLAERCRQAGMTLDVDISEEAGRCSVRIDRPAVERILMNLVDNAVKYGAAADGDSRIDIRAQVTGGRVQLRVEDNGPGVSRERRRRLFKPFSKSAAEAADSAPGVGLGLALSRRLARQMGGDLSYDDAATGGAAFVLGLEFVKRSSQPE
jgi:signal transduction histidine kinase